MKNYRLCKLYTAGGKLSQKWFVYYYYLNPRTALMERFRVFDGINIHRTAKLRRKAALELKEAIDKLLLQGWSPYSQEDQSDLVVPQLLGYTMAQLLDKFRQETEVFTRRQTQNSFSSTLNQYERWLKAQGWLQKYAQEFKRHHAQEYADYLVSRLHLTHTTRNNRIGHLKALYNRLIGKDPTVEVNPFDRVKNLKREQSARNLAFTPADQRRISTWLQLHDPALHLFVQFMYYTFIRPYELVRLRVRHIDLESGRICIPGEISKNRKTLYVAIPDSFRPVLEASGIQEHPGHWFVFSEKLQPGPGYTDRQGDMLGIHRNRVSERHLRALKAVELQQVYSLYSWKHTGVCRAFRAGVDILDLKAQLRHHSLEETGVYLKSLGVEVSDRLRQGFPAF